MASQLAGLGQGVGLKLVGEQVVLQVAAPENVGGVLLLVQGQLAADGRPDAEVGHLGQRDVLALPGQGEGVQAGGAGELLRFHVVVVQGTYHIEAVFRLAVVQAAEVKIGIEDGQLGLGAGGHIHVHQRIHTDEVEALVVGVVAQVVHGGVIPGRAGDLADLHRVLEAGVVHHIDAGYLLIATQLRGRVEEIAVAVGSTRDGDTGAVDRLTVEVCVAGEALPLTARKYLGGTHQGGGRAGEGLRNLYIVVGSIACIVCHSQLKGAAENAGDIQAHPALGALHSLVGGLTVHHLGAAGGQEDDGGGVPVVPGHGLHIIIALAGDRVKLGAHGHACKHRGGVVHGDLHGKGGALRVNLVPVHGVVVLQVILGRTLNHQLHGGALRQGIALFIRDHPVLAIGDTGHHGLAVVLPGAIVGEEEGGVDVVKFLVFVDLAGVHIGDGGAEATGCPDEAEVQSGDGVTGARADGIALREVHLVGGVGVAAQVILILRVVVRMGNRHIVEIRGAHVGLRNIGGLLVGTGFQLRVGHPVEHIGLVPAAVEGQHRNGVGGGQDAFLSSIGGGVGVGLDVSAVGEDLVQLFLHGVRQGDGDRHGDFAVCGQGYGVLAKAAQEQLSVIGGELAVPAQVGLVQVGEGVHLAHGVVKQRLAVGFVHLAVAVEVQTGKLPGLRQNLLAVDAVGGDGGELRQGVVGVPVLLAVLLQIELAVGLGEDIGVQGVLLGLSAQVVQGVVKGIDAGAVGVVPQLGLHLAVGLVLNHHIGGSVHGVAGVAQTGALLNYRIGQAGALVHNRSGGGHEQALGQNPGRDAQLLRQSGPPEVLAQQGHQAGVVRRGHGGAAHDHILVGSGRCTVDGVDIAAGGGDLGLQAQVAGDAPGAEIAHGIDTILREVDAGAHLVADGHGAGVVQRRSGLILHRGTGGPDGLGVRLGNAHAGNPGIALGQVHIDGCSSHVIINHADCRTGSVGVGQLLGEGDLTAGYEHNLAGDVNSLVVLRIAQAVQEDIGNLGAGAILRAVQRGQLRIVVQRLGVDHVPPGGQEAVAGHAGVVHGGHGEGVGICTGGAAGVEVHILGIERAVVGVLRPGAVVSGGHADHGIALGQLIQDFLIVGAGGKAGTAGAQGQIHHVAVQQNGILNGGHIVGVVGATGFSKDLHDNQLGVGSSAHHKGGFHGGNVAIALGDIAVGCGDARHMGAVAALTVIVMGHVQVPVNVVVGEGHLVGQMEYIGCQGVVLLENIVHVVIALIDV